MARQTGLGKGFSALFEENSLSDTTKDVQTLRLNDIEPNKDQPRKTFDEAALNELSQSIAKHGVLQPLLVRPMLGGGYQLVAGERRWRASRMAGLKEVPVVIKDLNDIQTMEIALIENLQREDLNPIEEAEGLQALITTCGMTQDEAALSVGRSRPAVANALRLLKLPGEVLEMTRNGDISAGHARALLAFDDPQQMLDVAKSIANSSDITVRQIEAMAKQKKQAPKTKISRRDSFYDEVEIALAQTLGRKIKVTNSGSKGKLEIEFYNIDDLKALANMFK